MLINIDIIIDCELNIFLKILCKKFEKDRKM